MSSPKKLSSSQKEYVSIKKISRPLLNNIKKTISTEFLEHCINCGLVLDTGSFYL